MIGRTMMSFIPASSLSACRIDRGSRSSRTTSRRTTGSVEASMAPISRARTGGRASSNAATTATRPMIRSVPGPRMSTGTVHCLPSSSIWSLTASRKSTRLKVKMPTTSSVRSCGPTWMTPRPRSPSSKPIPRKMIGKEMGARSTTPEASAETVSTMATRPKAVRRSGMDAQR